MTRPIGGAWGAGVVMISMLSLGGGPALAQLPPPRPLMPGAPKPGASIPAAGATAQAAAKTPLVPPHPAFKRRKPTAAMSAVHEAYARAITEPNEASYVNAGLVYDYDPGKLYTIHTSPRFLTVIALRPGEKLISKAAGDTVRWVLGETQQGGSERPQVLIIVKPVAGGLRTNLVLTTDQRVYLLEAVSHEEPYYTSLMSWHYPQEDMRDLRLAQAAATVDALARTSNVVATGLNIDKLRFDYTVAPQGRGEPPRWTPVRVFDDGAKTYIQFPKTLGTTDAPPLFLIGSSGAAELVNYRYSNGYYIVDRLIDVAELRLGDKSQAVVRITFTGARG